MTDKRIIGIDFGTSTSVIRVKSYQQNEQPINSKLDTKAVTFNNGVTTVPTLVQRVNDAYYFGHDAKVAKKGAELFRNFKLDLQSADAEKKEEAKKFTKEFFKYLYKEYHAQANGGHLGSIEEEESTIVSYPAKWNNETREFMLQAAKEAGFVNVTGMDEAEAAIRAVTVQCEDLLKQKRYLVQNKPVNILLIDMGAGTTDLVLCRYTPGDNPKNEILTTWPKEGDVLFGGRETDEILKEYISRYIPDAFREMLTPNLEANGTYKAWKEELVSPSLLAGNPVTEFSAADTLLQMMGSELDEFSLDRKEFENTAKNYLNSFPKLINSCLKNGGIKGEQIDLVITTGGHSQWYFVREFLLCKMSEFEKINLGKIKSDPNRIIGVSLPQETVALGLAYSGISSSFVAEDDTRHDAEENKMDSKYEEVGKDKNVDPSGNNEKENQKTSKNINRTDFLCPVEDVFSISGRGTVVTGKIERGTVKVGDTVEIVGLSNQVKTAVIDGIEMYRKTCDSAKEGDNVGLLLKGIGRDEVERGQVFCKPGSVKAGKSLKAEIRFITKEEGGLTGPILESDRYQFFFRTSDFTGTIISSTGKGVYMSGEMDIFYVDLVKPVALEEGLSFAVRKHGRNVGIGRVIEIPDKTEPCSDEDPSLKKIREIANNARSKFYYRVPQTNDCVPTTDKNIIMNMPLIRNFPTIDPERIVMCFDNGFWRKNGKVGYLITDKVFGWKNSEFPTPQIVDLKSIKSFSRSGFFTVSGEFYKVTCIISAALDILNTIIHDLKSM